MTGRILRRSGAREKPESTVGFDLLSWARYKNAAESRRTDFENRHVYALVSDAEASLPGALRALFAEGAQRASSTPPRRSGSITSTSSPEKSLGWRSSTTSKPSTTATACTRVSTTTHPRSMKHCTTPLETPSTLCAPGMNVRWRWKSSEKLGHRDLERCRKAPTARGGLKEAASGTHEPTNRNRIEGGGDSGASGPMTAKLP